MFTLGVVPYLNAVPLTVGMADDARLVAEVPSRLTALVEAGHVDAALLPVYEALRGVGDGWLGRYGIASRGAVGSVVLFLRRPLLQVRSLLLDPASRTSACLARHLVALASRETVRIETAAAPGPDPRAATEDAVLVIGDPALHFVRHWEGKVVDLGAAWTERTGLPFVFARWTARHGLDENRRNALATWLDETARRGVEGRGEAARTWARRRGEDPEAAAYYVVHQLRYLLGPEEEAGLERFARIARAEVETRRREADRA